MFVSYRAASRRPPPRMTMRRYFETFQVDGRAVLRGTVEKPRLWLARVDGVLLLCGSEVIHVRRVGEYDTVPSMWVRAARRRLEGQTSVTVH